MVNHKQWVKAAVALLLGFMLTGTSMVSAEEGAGTKTGTDTTTPAASGGGATTTTTTTGSTPAATASPSLTPLQKAYKRNRELRKDMRDLRRKLATQNARVKSLEAKLLQKDTKPVVDDKEFAHARRSKAGGVDSSGISRFFANFSWLWLLFSFAMLITGFFAGVAWLRERNRKKLGGMHLRV